MRRLLRLWSFEGRIGRAEYVATGAALFAVKYSIDLLIAARFGRAWSPLMYLSPRVSPLTTADPREAFWLWLLVAALPFIAAGIALSARRLRDMGYSPFWAGLFLLPFLHFLFFLVLAVAPPAHRAAEGAGGGPYREPAAEPPPPPGARLIPRHAATALVFGLAASLVIGWVAYVVGAHTHQLGAGMFVGAPFAMGFITSFAMNFWRPQTRSASIGYGLLTLLAAYVLLMALGWEGIACLIMASPIMAGLCVLGALLARAAALARLAPAALAVAPLIVAIDPVAPPRPEPFAVVSEIVIHAAPDEVWRHVVAFPPIDAPPEAIFALTAMPIEARIDGTGAGALRRCIFTTGEFEEPIEVWQPGRELTFGVRAQPAGLDGYLRVTRGQFLLLPHADGTTTLRGTTWMEVKVGPTSYWRAWTRLFVHEIHMRVLRHIQALAEHRGRAVAAAAQPAWMAAVNETCDCTRHAP
jgi:uncharacterized membrane protein YhaH (DUF805 family)